MIVGLPYLTEFTTRFDRRNRTQHTRICRLFLETSSHASNLQITRHPTLGPLLVAWVHWTHYGYGFCNMEETADTNHTEREDLARRGRSLHLTPMNR